MKMKRVHVREKRTKRTNVIRVAWKDGKLQGGGAWEQEKFLV